jgi:hypothetical protein
MTPALETEMSLLSKDPRSMLRCCSPGARKAIAGPLLALLGLLTPIRAPGTPIPVFAAEPGTNESAPAAAPLGQPYRSDTGRFEVLMPGTPEVVSTSRQTIGGRITSTEISVERDAFEFRVEYHDLPRIAEVLMSSGGILSRAKDDFLDAIRARERSSVETSVDGHPARTLSFEIPGDRELVGDGLLTLVGSRLYVVTAIHPRRDPRGGLLDRLLKTFTVWAR